MKVLNASKSTKYSMKVKVLTAEPWVSSCGLSFWHMLMGYLFSRKLDERFVLYTRFDCEVLEVTKFTKEKLVRIQRAKMGSCTMDGMTGAVSKLVSFNEEKKTVTYLVQGKCYVPPQETYIWY